MHWIKKLIPTIGKPLIVIIFTYIAYIAYLTLPHMLGIEKENTRTFIDYVIDNIMIILLCISFFWLIVRIINYLLSELYEKAKKRDFKISMIVIQLINNSAKIFSILILLNILLPFLPIPDQYRIISEKIASVLLIAAITWIILQIIHSMRDLVIDYYAPKIADSIKSRKIYTQITVIERISITITFIISISFILMKFDKMREIGGTLLASAGVIAGIITFAAQRTLSNIFAGLQIALTQPIRMNDVVIIENEFGSIEDITLTYVIVKLWDLRRLIVPINYFIEKSFQNWTRDSRDLFGTVMIYADYSLPIGDVRKAFQEYLKHSKLWDKKLGNLQVSDTKDHTIEIRMLVSAGDAGKLWDLRCEIREYMISYIQKNHPSSLPKVRIEKVK